ncbi:potassium channel protein [Bacillaceae bacterium Marseille-Q3522]|nr:potassium channel protein [Bacillaceae bacterium Marseille-Q3522]
MLNHLYVIFLRFPLAMRILMIALFFIVTFGTIIHYMEPDNFPTVYDGMWWAVITASTVGYGDLVPETLSGRVTAGMLILSGAGFISTYFAALATTAVTMENDYLEGKSTFTGQHHLVIIGWNERSRVLIDELSKENIKFEIVLIDKTLKRRPLHKKNIHFIKGCPHEDAVLLKGNIRFADKVIITADRDQDELQADMQSILTLIAIRGLNPEIHCIIEILSKEQSANARRAGADEIIEANQLTGMLMSASLTAPKMIGGYLELMHKLSNQAFLFPVKEANEYGGTFADANTYFLKKEMLLVGIKRGEQYWIKPDSAFLIKKNDELILIK